MSNYLSRRRLLLGITVAPVSILSGGCQRYAKVVDFPGLALSVPRDYFETEFNQEPGGDWVTLGAMFPHMRPASSSEWNSNSLIDIKIKRVGRNGTTADSFASRIERRASSKTSTGSPIPIVRLGDPLNFDARSSNAIEGCVLFRLKDGTVWSRCDPFERAANYDFHRQLGGLDVEYSLRKQAAIAAWEADSAVVGLIRELGEQYQRRQR